MDGQVVAIEENAADGFPQRGAARVAAGEHIATLGGQPLGQQLDLCRFSAAVRAVDGKDIPACIPRVTVGESAAVYCRGFTADVYPPAVERTILVRCAASSFGATPVLTRRYGGRFSIVPSRIGGRQ